MNIALTKTEQQGAVTRLVDDLLSTIDGGAPEACSAAIAILAAANLATWANDRDHFDPTLALFVETIRFIGLKMVEEPEADQAAIVKLALSGGLHLTGVVPWVSPRAEVAAYARLLEERLRANDHRGGWQNEKPEWLADRCLGAACDLNDALATLLSDGVRNLAANREALRRAAANVGNYAMMLADVTAPGGLAGKPDQATAPTNLPPIGAQ